MKNVHSSNSESTLGSYVPSISRERKDVGSWIIAFTIYVTLYGLVENPREIHLAYQPPSLIRDAPIPPFVKSAADPSRFELAGLCAACRISMIQLPIQGWTMTRRYSDFQSLHAKLAEVLVNLPMLPSKALFSTVDSAFLQRRQMALGTYLERLVCRRDVMSAKALFDFIGLADHLPMLPPIRSLLCSTAEDHSHQKPLTELMNCFPTTADGSHQPIEKEVIREPAHGCDMFALLPELSFLMTASNDNSTLSKIDGIMASFRAPWENGRDDHLDLRRGRLTLWSRDSVDAPLSRRGLFENEGLRCGTNGSLSVTAARELEGWLPVWYELLDSPVTALEAVPDGEAFVVGQQNGDVTMLPVGRVIAESRGFLTLFALLSGRSANEAPGLELPLWNHCSAITGIHFGGRNRNLVTTSKEGSVKVNHLEFIRPAGDSVPTGVIMRVTESYERNTTISKPVSTSSLEPMFGQLLILGFMDGSVELLDLRCGRVGFALSSMSARLSENETRPGCRVGAEMRRELSNGTPRLATPRNPGGVCSPHDDKITAACAIPFWDVLDETESYESAVLLLITADKSGKVVKWIAHHSEIPNDSRSRTIEDLSETWDAWELGIMLRNGGRDAVGGSNMRVKQELPQSVPRYCTSIAVDPHSACLFLGCRSGAVICYSLGTLQAVHGFLLHGRENAESSELTKSGATRGVTAMALIDVFRRGEADGDVRELWTSGRGGLLKVTRVPFVRNPKLANIIKGHRASQTHDDGIIQSFGLPQDNTGMPTAGNPLSRQDVFLWLREQEV